MISAIVLTKNSERTIATCINSLKFCNEILIVDDNSSDNTALIAKNLNAEVVSHSLNNDFAASRNWAITKAKHEWVLFIDSDEIISEALKNEITSELVSSRCNGYFLKRIDSIWDKDFKHGDPSQFKFIRLAKKTSGNWSGCVHETWNILGKTKLLKNPLMHIPHQNLYTFLEKINYYSTIRAGELNSQKYTPNILRIIFKPFLKFLYLYLIKLGFLDHTPGFIHAGTMSFYTFLVESKLYMLHKKCNK